MPLLRPLDEPQQLNSFIDNSLTAMSLEMIPRTTRAQTMDVLSSMATIGGYKAVLLAADKLPKMFPLLTTAAGTVPPAKVLVIGAGVAGLQAIATARRLGAVVEGFDIRSAAGEVPSCRAMSVLIEKSRSLCKCSTNMPAAVCWWALLRWCMLPSNVVIALHVP